MSRRARWLGSPGLAVISVVLVLGIGAFGCSDAIGPSPLPGPPPGPEAAVLVGAGDIAFCGSPGTIATAVLLDSIPGTVFTAGDNAYTHGSALDFAQCYDPSWGRHIDRTFPVLGNHDYEASSVAQYYFDYFGAAAGPRGLGYYKYNVGSWRVIALNSEFLPGGQVPNAAAAATQLQWLRNELASTNVPCTIAIWHRPLFSSGQNRSQTDTRDLYRALYDFNAEIVINGHDHTYERFAPQDADGRADAVRGIRQFIVGTGGVEPYRLFNRQANSDTFQTDTWGVLKLTLTPGAYTWEYIPIPGRGTRDTGNGVCH